jgi:hypothetical protein
LRRHPQGRRAWSQPPCAVPIQLSHHWPLACLRVACCLARARARGIKPSRPPVLRRATSAPSVSARAEARPHQGRALRGRPHQATSAVHAGPPPVLDLTTTATPSPQGRRSWRRRCSPTGEEASGAVAARLRRRTRGRRPLCATPTPAPRAPSSAPAPPARRPHRHACAPRPARRRWCCARSATSQARRRPDPRRPEAAQREGGREEAPQEEALPV